MNLRRLPKLLPLFLLAAACATAPRGDILGAKRELARELVKRREWAPALDLAKDLHRQAPRDPEPLLLRGIIYREQHLSAEAEADLKEAIDLAPGLAGAHAALGVLYESTGRGEEAVSQHRRAVELEPRNPAYLNNLGFALFAHGHAREAIPVLREALRESPLDPRLRNNLGFAYAAAGDFAQADEQFTLAGSPFDAKNNLGWAYERSGSLKQAFELYGEALRLEPGASIARQNLERVARALGRKVPAGLEPSPPRT